MLTSVSLKWKGKMAFEGDIDGFKVPIDADIETGGDNSAPRPKKFILLALAGCTGMDVASLLKKMRVEIEEFSIDVETSQTEAEHPHVYEWFKVIYKFKGNNLQEHKDKIDKAISLSQNKYCGVAAMLRKIGDVSYKVEIS